MRHLLVAIAVVCCPLAAASCIVETPAPEKDASAPMKDASADDAAAPLSDSAAPISDAAAPLSDSAAPISDAHAPLSDSAAPISDAHAPHGDAGAPVNDAAAPLSDAAAPVNDALAAMKRATEFMSEHVALNGGYVWVVSEDLTQRWGELRARPSQIWLQGGTEDVGEVFLEAYSATQDEYYLELARKAADALVYGQHPSGGWHYFIDYDPDGVAEWYETQASKFVFGMEEYRYNFGNATFDDRTTQRAAEFLLRFYDVTGEDAYREPTLRALDFVLKAQYPNGAWPQRYPLPMAATCTTGATNNPALPDYPSYYTLNDGVVLWNVQLLLTAWETLGDQRYYDAAVRGAEGLIALQGPPDQACWGEQHGPDLLPIAARSHEAAGYVLRESVDALLVLLQTYMITGDRRYVEAISPCLDWFDRINRESSEQTPIPRYWVPGTNSPLYAVETDERTPDGHVVYLWTTNPEEVRCDDPTAGQSLERGCSGSGQPAPFVDSLRQDFNQLAALTTPEERAGAYAWLRSLHAGLPQSDESVPEIIAALDERGAWVTDGNSVNEPNAPTRAEATHLVRGMSTRVFVARMSSLIASLNER